MFLNLSFNYLKLKKFSCRNFEKRSYLSHNKYTWSIQSYNNDIVLNDTVWVNRYRQILFGAKLVYLSHNFYYNVNEVNNPLENR